MKEFFKFLLGGGIIYLIGKFIYNKRKKDAVDELQPEKVELEHSDKKINNRKTKKKKESE